MTIRLFDRIRRGDSRKRSRFHDFSGRPIEAASLLSVPASLASTLAFKAFGWRPRLPWLGFRAIRCLRRLLRPDWRVLEMGSGFSSPWFAARCAQLTTIESDPRWLEVTRQLLAGRTNVVLRLSQPPFSELFSELEAGFDFALVDGLARERAAALVVAKVRPGGYVYLDNSDVQDQEHQGALATLLERSDPAFPARRFTDFYPGEFSAMQGVLVRLRDDGA